MVVIKENTLVYTLVCFDLAVGVVVVVFPAELAKAQVEVDVLSRAWVFVSQFMLHELQWKYRIKDTSSSDFPGHLSDPGCQQLFSVSLSWLFS